MSSKAAATVDNRAAVRRVLMATAAKLTLPQPATPAEWDDLFAPLQAIISLLTKRS